MTKSQFRVVSLLTIALVASSGVLTFTYGAERPPNFVIIFADDLGYGDVGEKRDIADRYPEVVARLQKQAETIRAELGDVRTTGTDQRTINLVEPQER